MIAHERPRSQLLECGQTLKHVGPFVDLKK